MKKAQLRRFTVIALFILSAAPSQKVNASRASSFSQILGWNCSICGTTRFTLTNISSTYSQTVTVAGGISAVPFATPLFGYACSIVEDPSSITSPFTLGPNQHLVCEANSTCPGLPPGNYSFWATVNTNDDRGALVGEGVAMGNCGGASSYDRVVPVSFNGRRPF